MYTYWLVKDEIAERVWPVIVLPSYELFALLNPSTKVSSGEEVELVPQKK